MHSRENASFVYAVNKECSNTELLNDGSLLRVHYSPSQELKDHVSLLQYRLLRLLWWHLGFAGLLALIVRPHFHCRHYVRPPPDDGSDVELGQLNPLQLAKTYEKPRICCLREALLVLPLSHSLRDVVISYTDAVWCCEQVYPVLGAVSFVRDPFAHYERTRAGIEKLPWPKRKDSLEPDDVNLDPQQAGLGLGLGSADSRQARAKRSEWDGRSKVLHIDISTSAGADLRSESKRRPHRERALDITRRRSDRDSEDDTPPPPPDQDEGDEPQAAAAESDAKHESKQLKPLSESMALTVENAGGSSDIDHRVRRAISDFKDLRQQLSVQQRMDVVFEVVRIYSEPQPIRLSA